MPTEFKKLDNPAWYALAEKQAVFARGSDVFKRFDPGIVLFAGFHSIKENSSGEFDKVIGLQESFFLFDILPALPSNYIIESVIDCLQMVCKKPIAVPVTENIIPLDEGNREEMYNLVSTVFPGYYLPDTRRMGDYLGIFDEGRLVAMAGERLRMDGLTEISAVVTDPAYTGRKYAQQLITQLNDKNMQSGNIPFLHCGATNERAISVYKLLGFEKRRIIPVTKFKRVG